MRVRSVGVMVREFRERCGHRVQDWPGELPSGEEIRLERRLAREEHRELEKALKEHDVLAIADALGDLVYVLYGTAHAFGIDLDAVVREIHRSNMTKFEGGARRRRDGKVLKGPGYEPPDIAGAIGGAGQAGYEQMAQGLGRAPGAAPSRPAAEISGRRSDA